MAEMVRGVNPIWTEFDLTGNIFDDTYYLFVLENTIPYAPAVIYEDEDGTVPRSNPVQFLANGTLPIDLYFDPDIVYRLEFRKGNTSSDPLIYLVENYVPGEGSGGPVGNVALTTDNQITNSQFSLISFGSPLELMNVTDPDPVEIGPGWFLNLTGTGSATITRIPLNNDLSNPTNAPYAIQITLSGNWDEFPYLSQRFDQNGMLWSQKYVSNSVTAQLNSGSGSISGALYDSNGTLLVNVLSDVTISADFEEYVDYGLVPETTNPDFPPDAYIEYRLILPTSVDIFLTSIQLVSSEVAFAVNYDEETIQRQVDHTFHYYYDSILRQPKSSILAGWDFGLNPWQFNDPSGGNVATNEYTADQTIMIQQAYVNSATGNNVNVSRGTLAQNYGYLVTSVTATNQFAILQYIEPKIMRPLWGRKLSAFVKLTAQKQSAVSELGLKCKLIYKAGLPSTTTQTEPVATWAALGEPVYAAGWTAIDAPNDPVYLLEDGENTLVFDGFELPVSTNANMTLGIIIYTLDPMDESGTADNILFERVSLVPNDYAIDCPSLSYDESLKRCEYYYETSYDSGVLPGTATGVGSIAFTFSQDQANVPDMAIESFFIHLRTAKHSSTYDLTLYDLAGTANRVSGRVYDNGVYTITNTPINTNHWTTTGFEGEKAISFLPDIGVFAFTGSVTTAPYVYLILFHYVIDARLGV